MSKLSLSEIVAAVEAAFQSASAQPQRVAVHSIGENVSLRTDLYVSPGGPGFAVTVTVDLTYRKLVIVKQSGPETWREKPVPSLDALIAEARSVRAKRYEAEASVYDLADAEAKIASPDPAVQADGAAQKAAVLAKRLEIKAAIPLPL